MKLKNTLSNPEQVERSFDSTQSDVYIALKKLGVELKSYIVKRHGKDFEYVIVGGIEVISRKSFKDSGDEELESLRKTKRR